MKDLDIFISGETIDLCIPTKEFAAESNWYSWFNNPSITTYLEQGLFPNTQLDQEEFFMSQRGKRLMLIISTKTRKYKGVVSLSFLDFSKKSCDFAIVSDSSIEPAVSPYANLEAVALISSHGFKNLGMLRISAGQHIALGGFQQRLELLGYKLEGLRENGFRKGHESSNSMTINCSYDDYLFLTKNRGGQLWDGLSKMKNRIKELPKKSFKDELANFYESRRADYYDRIFQL